MLLDLPPWAVESVRKDTRFFVLDYAIPTTHVLQFNPNSQPLKCRELRLALSYAIDAQRILSQRILRSPDSLAGRLSTAPFATTSYAYNGLLTRRDFNANMAFSLHAAAVKRLKTLSPLRLVCEHDPEALSAAGEMIAQWKRVGIVVELVQTALPFGSSRTAARPLTWDIAYRKLRMEEPVVELWPFLTVNSGARLESVRTMPDWLRIELLDFDSAPIGKQPSAGSKRCTHISTQKSLTFRFGKSMMRSSFARASETFPLSSSSTPIRTSSAGLSSPGFRRTSHEKWSRACADHFLAASGERPDSVSRSRRGRAAGAHRLLALSGLGINRVFPRSRNHRGLSTAGLFGVANAARTNVRSRLDVVGPRQRPSGRTTGSRRRTNRGSSVSPMPSRPSNFREWPATRPTSSS